MTRSLSMRGRSGLQRRSVVWLALVGQLVACTQLLGLDEVEQRPASGGSSAGGSSAGGSTAGGAAGGSTGGAAGSAGSGGAGATGGSGGAGAGGATGGAAGSGGTGGNSDSCPWAPLEAPWVQVSINGSFENWPGSMPSSWTDADRNGTTGDYAKVAGCAGKNALRLTDTAMLATQGRQHGARGFFISPTSATTSCWVMRAYGRRESGSFASGSAGLIFHSIQDWQDLDLGITSSWQPKSITFQVEEEIVSSAYVQVAIGADYLDGVTAVDFDNIELWYQDGQCPQARRWPSGSPAVAGEPWLPGRPLLMAGP